MKRSEEFKGQYAVTLSRRSAGLRRLSGISGLLVILLLQGDVSAQEKVLSEPDTVVGAASSGFYPLPILYYTPETDIAGGAAVMYLYKNVSSRRASTVTADVIYTGKRQFIVEASGDQYFGGEYRLLSDLSGRKYPNKFFGIGNDTPDSGEETYTARAFNLQAVLYKSIAANINVGPGLVLETTSIVEPTEDGLIAAGAVPGSKGGTSVGIGIVANRDTRDNTFAAESGSLCEVTIVLYRRAFGSDYSYNDVRVDVRNFISVFSHHVIAFQGVAESIDGTAPFQHYAEIGGQNLMRGYFEGRYRDKNSLAFQAEYRLPVWWRIGAVAFAGAAQVANRIGGFAFNRFWLSGGAGLRFAWSPEERVNIRLDYGVGSGSSGMYITLSEAF
jgi:hypothetical protein